MYSHVELRLGACSLQKCTRLYKAKRSRQLHCYNGFNIQHGIHISPENCFLCELHITHISSVNDVFHKLKRNIDNNETSFRPRLRPRKKKVNILCVCPNLALHLCKILPRSVQSFRQ